MVLLIEPFVTFDISSLTVTVSAGVDVDSGTFEHDSFELLYSYSIDATNYADHVTRGNFSIPPEVVLPVYISIMVRFKSRAGTGLNAVKSLDVSMDNFNLDYVNIDSITYDSTVIDINDKDVVGFIMLERYVDRFPRWNVFDGIDVSVRDWKERCFAASSSRGFPCVYFKTTASETNNTFSVNNGRKVTNIKKLMVQFPDGDVPQDKLVYSDWDLALPDDIILHVVIERFKIAFGDVIPVEKDYVWVPFLSRLYRVTGANPVRKFMGQVAWWEVFLAKWEDDQSVTMDSRLLSAYQGVPGLSDVFNEPGLQFMQDGIEDDDVDLTGEMEGVDSSLLGDLDAVKASTILTPGKLTSLTSTEKRESNQSYTNKNIDSNFHVSLKETEAQREFYDRRLKIVSVNPDINSFPVMMYDNTRVVKRTVALFYNMDDYTSKNKFSTVLDKNLALSFNYIPVMNFAGELFDLVVDNEDVVYSVKMNRSYMEFTNNSVADSNSNTFKVNLKFELMKFYQVVIGYDLVLKQVSVNVFNIENHNRTLAFNDIHVFDGASTTPLNINKVGLYGGSFYSGTIRLEINNKMILEDNVNPFLEMKQF
jgi:hypothetical protein